MNPCLFVTEGEAHSVDVLLDCYTQLSLMRCFPLKSVKSEKASKCDYEKSILVEFLASNHIYVLEYSEYIIAVPV